MIAAETVEAVILKALDNLNAELPDDQKIPVDLDTVLFGVDARIDSLALISVVVDVETTLTADYGLDIALTDDRAVSQPSSPFASARALRDYVMTLVAEQAGG